MTTAHDLFAETNPAFGAFAIAGFCSSYESVSGTSPSLSLLYLSIPIAFSDDTQESFEKTNATTGLLSWLNRFPDIRINLGARLDASLDIVTSAVKLGVQANALRLHGGGLLGVGHAAPAAKGSRDLPEHAKRVIKRAERLGGWMAKVGSAAAVFSAFGVEP
ncbi:three component ABC system middle component [Devosia sp. A449]